MQAGKKLLRKHD